MVISGRVRRPLPRPRRTGTRILRRVGLRQRVEIVATLCLVLCPLGAASTSSAMAEPVQAVHGTACTGGHGVTVVVDSSSIGGGITVGCAPSSPPDGLAALTDAGFRVTRAQSGLVCAIDARPDPCPTRFTGSYWSYWHAGGGGRWIGYQTGPSQSRLTAGAVEGWRYGTGTAGPAISPSHLPAARGSQPGRRAPAGQAKTPSVTWPIWAGGAAALIAVLIASAALRSRRKRVTPGS